jgi:hypothetical protein
MNKKIILFGILGIAGSLLMFSGDMLFYFTNEDYTYVSDNISIVMGTMPAWRLQVGGFLGIVAGFLYLFGYYMIYKAVEVKSKKPAVIIFFIWLFCTILGAGYHSHFPYLGYAARYITEVTVLTEFENMLIPYVLVNMSLHVIVSSYFAILIIAKKTLFPRWFVVLTPIVLLWVIYLLKQLPSPFSNVLAGGWYNLMNTIFFLAAIMVLKKRKEMVAGMKDNSNSTNSKTM